ncbi:hypothetical protein KKC45_02570 [Patescibacteria group bacterium]|nr:hypothetical protein [Patescibacteria group bacterium]
MDKLDKFIDSLNITDVSSADVKFKRNPYRGDPDCDCCDGCDGTDDDA